MWILGKEEVAISLPWYQTLFSKKKSQPKSVPKPDYLKRVVVICRLKGDPKIMLKCFKEIPAKSLEMLLPSGRTGMTVKDKLLLAGSTAAGVFTIVGEVTLFLAYSKLYFMNLVLPTVLTSLLTGTAVLFNYTSKSKKYLEDLHRISYFKTVANNRGFLALMVDRAQDETFKEALIVYMCILSHRPPGARHEDTGYYQMVIAELGKRELCFLLSYTCITIQWFMYPNCKCWLPHVNEMLSKTINSQLILNKLLILFVFLE